MRWLGRLLLVALALPVAIAAGAVALVFVTILDPVMAGFAGAALRAGFATLLDALAALDDPGLAMASAASGFGRLALTILVVPPVFLALMSEVAGARSLLWHAGATSLLTAALPWLARGTGRAPTPEEAHITLVLALVGAVSGLVYWLIAGRGAGPARAREAPESSRAAAGSSGTSRSGS